MRIRNALLAALIPMAAGATEPLSVIEWLGDNPTGIGGPVLLEPPVSDSATLPKVDVTPLEVARLPIGLVPSDVTGLPPTLWAGSDSETLIRLLQNVSVRDSPALQKLIYTLLLSETIPPEGDGAAHLFLLARLDRLMELGATDPAQALAETAGPTRDAALFSRWYDAALLTGAEDQGCAILEQRPYLSPDYTTRIFCQARQGDWQTAALTLEAAHALELLPQEKLDLMDRFLSPDVFEGAPPLPVPSDPNPLTFRLFETIGERLPTASLPRAFATADLRDVAGWKAQLEAAERLTRIGALSPNQLLGLYTDRRPSASGGLWDRVQAVQDFDAALQSGDADAVAGTLPPVWNAMRQAHLEVPFAMLFAEQLDTVSPPDSETRALIWRIRLLSPDFAAAARDGATDDPEQVFLAALAAGDPMAVPAPDATAAAIAEGFAPVKVKPRTAPQWGENLLRAMIIFDAGAKGNPAELSEALFVFRASGLEDTARSAALQVRLLGVK